MDKRRGRSTRVAIIVLACTIVLLLWTPSGCPGPPQDIAGSFLLVLPGNASLLPPAYPISTLPAGDIEKLIDLQSFGFLVNNLVCNKSYPYVLALVHSSPENVKKRIAIRETWGTQFKIGMVAGVTSIAILTFWLPSCKIASLTIFLLGIPKNSSTQTMLLAENEAHHDIVQGSFVDAYRNMTYKHVMGLKWVTYYCPGARYILKTDDDVFVNPGALHHYLRTTLSPHGARNLIWCRKFLFGRVRRSYRSKWRVSFSEYGKEVYPPYCPGWAIMYSPDAVFRLYKESQEAEYFWIDDVFITGLMANRANVPLSDFGDIVLSNDRLNDVLEKKAFPQDFFILGPPDLPIDALYALWRVVERSAT